MSRVLALICARGGSKGLPGKNLRVLAGKPLIGWAIEQAAAVPRIERIIVSTDSMDIASVAKAFGADVPFIRPSELARDDTPEWLVWQHALSFLREQDCGLPKSLVVVPATAPLRSPLDIENCIDEYEKGEADIVVTVTDARRNPFFNMVKVEADNNVRLVIPRSSQATRRQDVPVVYDMTTVAYVARPGFVLTQNGLFAGRVRAVHVPLERAVDIDTAMDLKIAECLLCRVSMSG